MTDTPRHHTHYSGGELEEIAKRTEARKQGGFSVAGPDVGLWVEPLRALARERKR